VGGSGRQIVVFDEDGSWRAGRESDLESGAEIAAAIPGEIAGGRVVRAVNLDLADADPVEALGLPRPPAVLLNDAEAAALGEAVLAGGDTFRPLTLVTLGTGVGGAVVNPDGSVTTNLFGHSGRHSEITCTCGRRGCLETVAAGWALPTPLVIGDIVRAASAIARAVAEEPAVKSRLLVISGGIAAAHPGVIDAIAAQLPKLTVRRSHAPAGLKSAAAFGMRHRALAAVPT
jgi:predicted NBD/HSP70 family sugar kinase